LLKHAYTVGDIRQLAARSRFGGAELRSDGVAFDLRLVKQAT
jgi:hypothetical protein